MDFSSPPSPPSSNSDSSSYFADEFSNESSSLSLGLDPSDPLNLLLHDTAHRNANLTSMDDRNDPPDWSQLASLWPMEGMKYPELGGMEFNLTFPMDMDYNPSLTVEPSALHFDQKGCSQPIFSHPPTTPLDMSPPPSYDDPVDELAQRVRQSAGVMLAVPVGLNCQPSPTQANIPVPRLPKPKIIPKAKRILPKSDASSTSSTPPPDSAAASPGSNPFLEPTVPGVVGRPKTSHTTIERRYRTNLNARIQSLRRAVPALRVLEEKGSKDVEAKEKPIVDVVDERGFVDGVKVARKCSKANVLGKAVEYIRVLKKREKRLTHEQSGLKSLICGLVGGPALLREWEQEWRDKFGGAEKDEVEGEEMEPLSDDDEGDDEDGEGDEDDGRAKKKAKIVKAPVKTKKLAPPPATMQAALDIGSTVLPEKRKRGRPKKVVPPTSGEVSPPVDFISPSDGQVQHDTQTAFVSSQPQGQAPQYLLATFALFSFFNSPLTSSSPPSTSHPHAHTGSVLGHGTLHPSPSAIPAVAAGLGWREIIQAFHLLVSALVFFSIVVPWLPAGLKRYRPVSYLLWSFSWLLPDQEDKSSPTPQLFTKAMGPSTSFDRAALVDVLSSPGRGSADEAEQLRDTLGVSAGWLGLVQGVFRRTKGAESQRGLEQRAWIRLSELAAFDSTTCTGSRLQTYWSAWSHISFYTASTSELSTLALVIRPLSGSKAASLWTRAKKTRVVPYEKLVLESLTVDEAAERLAAQPASEWKHNPIAVLAAMLLRERLKRYTTILFVRTVLPDCGCVEDTEKEEKVIIDAARSLGGRTGELAEVLERVWKTEALGLDDIFAESSDESEGEREIKALLSALILYRRLFPPSVLSCSGTNANRVSTLLSPPPSPSRKNAELYMTLRRVLGSSVFDFPGDLGQSETGDVSAEPDLGVVLEEARDRVVDMLVDFERKSRGGTGDGVF